MVHHSEILKVTDFEDFLLCKNFIVSKSHLIKHLIKVIVIGVSIQNTPQTVYNILLGQSGFSSVQNRFLQ